MDSFLPFGDRSLFIAGGGGAPKTEEKRVM